MCALSAPLSSYATPAFPHVLAVNDFAAVNVDSEMIASESKDTGVVELTNGCICCSKKGDLVDKVRCEAVAICGRGRGCHLQYSHTYTHTHTHTHIECLQVWSILKDADSGNVDYLVIETSGVTDPCTVVQTLEADFGKMFRIRLDSVVLVRLKPLHCDCTWYPPTPYHTRRPLTLFPARETSCRCWMQTKLSPV
jgi:hypothetical protein